MSNITVSLSTSGNLVASTWDEATETRFWKDNIPVCAADMGAFMSGDMKIFSDVCLEMAKEVYIDPDKKYVFVGKDPNQEDTGLVVYTEIRPNIRPAEDFFKRWIETNFMFFQFRVSYGDKPYFALMGGWKKDHWDFLRLSDRALIKTCLENPYEKK